MGWPLFVLPSMSVARGRTRFVLKLYESPAKLTGTVASMWQ